MLVTRNPTANQTPDPVVGGDAIAGITNTGHPSAIAFVIRDTNGTTSALKSAIWTALQNVSGQVKSINLRFSWNGALSVVANTLDVGDQSDVTVGFVVGYSVNGGGAWNNQVVQTLIASAADGSIDSDGASPSGSETISIPITTPIDQIQIRDSIFSEVTISEVSAADGSGSANLEITDIRVEIVLADGGVMCGM